MSNLELKGQGLSSGQVVGLASFARNEHSMADTLSGLIEAAKRRYERHSTNPDIPEEAREIALVYLSLLEDPALLHAMQSRVEAQLPVREAVQGACDEMRRTLETSQNKYLRERAHDLSHLAQDLLSSFNAGTYSAILLVTDLTPTKLFLAKEGGAKGVVCKARLPVSGHLAILARSLGLVLVAGVDDLERLENMEVTLDGLSGQVCAGQAISASTRSSVDFGQLPLWINVSSSAEIRDAPYFGGVGLFRTEFIYLRVHSVPQREVECQEYAKALTYAQGKPVIFRLLDFGADKPIPGRPAYYEENPMLGRRGIRLLLDEPELLRRQLELLVSVAHLGDMRIMVPMVTAIEEILQVRSMLQSLGGENIPLGAMVETPAAALLAPELCQVCDFLSLGTNDLSAYVYAKDRLSMGSPFCTDTTALRRIIKLVAYEASAVNRTLGVCGEMAAEASLAQWFLEIGCNYLSVSISELEQIAKALE